MRLEEESLLSPRSLWGAQFIAHVAFCYLLYAGSLFHWAVVFTVYFVTGCIGMTATYHRLLSHKSWSCPKWIEYLGVLCATVGLTGSALSWVAIHRTHHRFSDTERDPHSPSFKGFIYCQWFSMFSPVSLKIVPDLLRQRFYIIQHQFYFLINILYAAVLYFIDPFALVYAWLVPACVLWNAGSFIITLSHLFGRNDHNLSGAARNSFLLGFLVWGEGWHNNHHFDPKLKRFGEKWWQVDIGYFYILLVESLFSRKQQRL